MWQIIESWIPDLVGVGICVLGIVSIFMLRQMVDDIKDEIKNEIRNGRK